MLTYYQDGIIVKAHHHPLNVMTVKGIEVLLDKFFLFGHGHALLMLCSWLCACWNIA